MKRRLGRRSQDGQPSWGPPLALAKTFGDPHLDQGTLTGTFLRLTLASGFGLSRSSLCFGFSFVQRIGRGGLGSLLPSREILFPRHI
jgi:hypothetical protein